jgi:putative lipoic acid-binding regulatory protein
MNNEKDIKLHDLTLKDGETLFEFPCKFPIKAMGLTCDELEIAVIEIINRHVEDLSEGALSMKPSKNGKYTAITVTITAHSKDQLDAIYMELTACEHVSIAL